MLDVARQVMGAFVEDKDEQTTHDLMAIAEVIDDIYEDVRVRRDGRVLRPYHHHAPVGGRMTVFANLEYPTDSPPDVIEIDELVYVKV